MDVSWSKLQSPVALVLQGFVAGAILYFVLQPFAGVERPSSTLGSGSVLQTLQA